MISTPCLDALFSNVGEADFLERHWPYTWSVHHGSARRLGALVSAAELVDHESLLACHSGPTKALFTDAAGQHVEVPYATARALAPWRFGTPLCLGDLGASLPVVDEWRRDLASELGVPLDASTCGAFVAPRGGVVPRHFDNREVIVVQVRGRKRWLLEQNHDVCFPTQSWGPAVAWNWDSYRELGSYFDPASRRQRGKETVVEMAPGSALFLPRGMWHATEALEDSISLTFSFYTPSRVDRLLTELRSRLVASPEWRRPAVRGEGREDLLAALAERCAREIGGPDETR